MDHSTANPVNSKELIDLESQFNAQYLLNIIHFLEIYPPFHAEIDAWIRELAARFERFSAHPWNAQFKARLEQGLRRLLLLKRRARNPEVGERTLRRKRERP